MMPRMLIMPLLGSLLVTLSFCKAGPGKFTSIAGETQGTTYHMKYEGEMMLKPQVDSLLRVFDLSLSQWEPNSIISRINRNEPDVEPDSLFYEMFTRAMEISALSEGAFDITVGPLVNAYGFGFKSRDSVSAEMVDSLLQFVGWQKLHWRNGRIEKDDSRMSIDPNAIAQGQAVDMIYQYFLNQGLRNFMVEIGGEVRTKGKNHQGEDWRIGIDKPIENTDETNRSLQVILQLSEKALSTSGNYRKFYERDGLKFSHTIDPKTGYPVHHSLLSATVVAGDCITADALSTTLMVWGLEKSQAFLKNHPELDAFLIYSDASGQFADWSTPGLKGLIRKAE
jgi:thiamine biosynthesis lipoprotein